MIADLPDDARIYADDSMYSTFGDDISEYVCIIYCYQFPNKVLFRTKNDFEVDRELEAMSEVAVEEGWGDEQFYMEALELGYTAEDFPDPEVARKQMEEHGLI